MRVSERKHVFNVRRNRAMKDAVKEVRQLAGAGKAAEALALLPKAYQAIDKAAKRGVIKPNAAARKKSRLTKALREQKEVVKKGKGKAKAKAKALE